MIAKPIEGPEEIKVEMDITELEMDSHDDDEDFDHRDEMQTESEGNEEDPDFDVLAHKMGKKKVSNLTETERLLHSI